MIEIKNLTKRYGQIRAVDDISLTIKKGEILGFLGPNGAGKSTTMNILTGYISATSGSVSVGGYDIMDSPREAKRLIGYLPEQPPLYYDMTVNEYLRFICDLKSVPLKQRRRQLDEILYLVKIGDREGRRYELARLSGGDMITDIQLAGAEELLARDERFRASLS